MHILWIIIIGFVAGIVARFLAPGPNNPAGFILITLLDIAGAFVATFIGQMIGWYGPNQGAGLIGAVVGALLVLFIWHRLVMSHAIPDPVIKYKDGACRVWSDTKMAPMGMKGKDWWWVGKPVKTKEAAAKKGAWAMKHKKCKSWS